MVSYAEKMLLQAQETLQDRAKLRDTPNGERSMDRTVAAFNSLTGNSLSTLDGWLFMLCLKLARSQQGGYHPDDFLDLVGYAVLAGEEAELINTQEKE